MSTKRYTDEFKIEAVNQVLDRGYRVAEVAERLGVSPHSLYQWINKRREAAAPRSAQLPPAEELRRLKAELKRVTEERDILKKAAAYFAKQSG
jgi:transposase